MNEWKNKQANESAKEPKSRRTSDKNQTNKWASGWMNTQISERRNTIQIKVVIKILVI